MFARVDQSSVLELLQWFDADSGDSGLTSNTGMSYFFTLVNTTRCGPMQRQARAEFIQGCQDDLEFRDQYVLAYSDGNNDFIGLILMAYAT